MTEVTIRLFDPKLAAAHSPDLPDASCTHPDVERAWREWKIRDAAYFRSLRRSPCPGKEIEDWLAAEREVDGVCAKRL
jgi:hypothetical protein